MTVTYFLSQISILGNKKSKYWSLSFIMNELIVWILHFVSKMEWTFDPETKRCGHKICLGSFSFLLFRVLSFMLSILPRERIFNFYESYFFPVFFLPFALSFSSAPSPPAIGGSTVQNQRAEIRVYFEDINVKRTANIIEARYNSPPKLT